MSRIGASGVSEEEHPERVRILNLHIPAWLVARINRLRIRQAGNVSQNTRILEVIEDRVERESGG
jgi:hypothetical protein